MARLPWGQEPKTRSRQLAPHRSGTAGALRQTVREMLLRLLGFREEEWERFAEGKYQRHHLYHGQHPLPAEEALQLAAVAHDALLELGYEAPAELLREMDARRRIQSAAADALLVLDAGPPSIYMGEWGRWAAIDKRSLQILEVPSRYQPGVLVTYAIGREVGEPTRPWRLFHKGQAVHNARGQWEGVDREKGWTLLTYHKTKKDALEHLRRST